MPFHAVGRSFRPSGGSYAPDNGYYRVIIDLQIHACAVSHHTVMMPEGAEAPVFAVKKEKQSVNQGSHMHA